MTVSERAFGEQEIEFEVLSGELEMTGVKGKQTWQATIFLAPFVETVLGVIEFGHPTDPTDPASNSTKGSTLGT